MDYNSILHTIQETLIIPLILLVGGVIIKVCQAKLAEWKVGREDKLIAKYIDRLSETIEVCVTATNQTYVNSLKEKNMFDEEAQKTAFQNTLNAVKASLTEEAKKYLTMAYGDLDLFLRERIESSVGYNRLDVSEN